MEHHRDAEAFLLLYVFRIKYFSIWDYFQTIHTIVAAVLELYVWFLGLVIANEWT